MRRILKQCMFIKKNEASDSLTEIILNIEVTFYTVGKHTPCKLSFVYTSYIRYGVRAAPKFGKHASLFSYHNE